MVDAVYNGTQLPSQLRVLRTGAWYGRNMESLSHLTQLVELHVGKCPYLTSLSGVAGMRDLQ